MFHKKHKELVCNGIALLCGCSYIAGEGGRDIY